MKKPLLFAFFIILLAGVWAITTFAIENYNGVDSVCETTEAIPNEPTQPTTQEPTLSTTPDSQKPRNQRARVPGKECPSYLTDRPEEIVYHNGFTLSYNNKRLIPNWVAWVMTPKRVAGTEKRANNFQPDLTVKNGPVAYDSDYRGSGFDRGHMCPAADCKHTRQSQNDCFLLSNICPQNHELNCGDWNKLENKTRKWINRCDSLYIVCGPIINKQDTYETIGENNVMIPKQFFKVILRFNRSNVDAIGFVFDNDSSNQPLNQKCLSVDEVEALTGINFFSKLPKDIERKVEAQCNYEAW